MCSFLMLTAILLVEYLGFFLVFFLFVVVFFFFFFVFLCFKNGEKLPPQKTKTITIIN